MFNIGGQGQYIDRRDRGGLGRHDVGEHARHPARRSSRSCSPTLAGALWAGIAGILKATVGAHEVITTIMLNWIAYWVGTYLFGLGGPLQNDANESVPISNDIVAERQAARLLGQPGAPGAAHRLLHRASRRSSSTGSSSTGRRSATRCARSATTRKPRATAGINVARNYFLAMAIAGQLRGARRRARHPRLAVPARRRSTSRRRRSASSASRSRCSAVTPRSASVFVRAAVRRAAHGHVDAQPRSRASSRRSSPAT